MKIINMKIYLVGGAVRDKILGIPIKDRDYLVVGSSPEEMIKLGYKPIGKDFPVFLHPETNEEYALANAFFLSSNWHFQDRADIHALSIRHFLEGHLLEISPPNLSVLL